MATIRRATYTVEEVNLDSAVRVRKDETLEGAITRFKTACKKSGITEELKKREYHVGPSEKRRLKSLEAEKKRKKK